MNATELRIGNLIFEKGYELTIGVIDAHYQCIQVYNSPRKIPIEDLTPIPLTEEWLTKFGFKNFFKNYWENDKFTLEFNGEFLWASEGTEYQISIGYKYIHQLQTLYFALTGEELQIL